VTDFAEVVPTSMNRQFRFWIPRHSWKSELDGTESHIDYIHASASDAAFAVHHLNRAVSALVAAARKEEREAACAMILAWADAEDRMAEECKQRGLGDAATTRFRVRNLLKNASDRVRTHQPAPDSGLYENEDAAAIRALGE